MIILRQFYSEILWKSDYVIRRTEVAEYRHLSKLQYLKDNVLTAIIPPPPKKKTNKQTNKNKKQTNKQTKLRPSLLTIHMWVLWNAKLTETRILVFRELSIEIESSLIELKSSLIQLKSFLIQLESS